MEQDRSLKRYRPLLIIFGLIVLGALALAQEDGHFLEYFMGLFFLLFSLFKLLDLEGFAKSFAMYDLVTQRWAPYGKLYPFIELLLALLYLSHSLPFLTNLVTLLVMGAGTVGIARNLRNKDKIKCACLGAVINLPLGTISLIENIGMGLMAFIMLMRLA